MRIYISNILPSTLTNKINKLTNYFDIVEETTKYEIYSKEFGLHIIDKKQLKHVETSFTTDYELIKGYNGLDLLIDKMEYNYIPVLSQLPVNYISTKIYELKFKLHKKSKLTLIIDCIEETHNFEKNLIPINFYFNYNEEKIDLKEHFFQEDFNVFLSQLN